MGGSAGSAVSELLAPRSAVGWVPRQARGRPTALRGTGHNAFSRAVNAAGVSASGGAWTFVRYLLAAGGEEISELEGRMTSPGLTPLRSGLAGG
jgi:hypothetical protein